MMITLVMMMLMMTVIIIMLAVMMMNSRGWLNFLFFFRWKIHESCMLAMGCIKSLIIEKVSNGKVSMADMTSFLTQVVLADLQESGNSL